jgi:N-acetylmuramoyl-L-alanine amidase
MTNPEEDQKMATEDYQNLMAEGMADGIDHFLGR